MKTWKTKQTSHTCLHPLFSVSEFVDTRGQMPLMQCKCFHDASNHTVFSSSCRESGGHESVHQEPSLPPVLRQQRHHHLRQLHLLLTPLPGWGEHPFSLPNIQMIRHFSNMFDVLPCFVVFYLSLVSLLPSVFVFIPQFSALYSSRVSNFLFFSGDNF